MGADGEASWWHGSTRMHARVGSGFSLRIRISLAPIHRSVIVPNMFHQPLSTTAFCPCPPFLSTCSRPTSRAAATTFRRRWTASRWRMTGGSWRSCCDVSVFEGHTMREKCLKCWRAGQEEAEILDCDIGVGWLCSPMVVLPCGCAALL